MLGVAATGVVAFLLWKAVLVFLLPFIGVAVGVVFLVVKVVFFAGVLCVAMWLYRRMARRQEELA